MPDDRDRDACLEQVLTTGLETNISTLVIGGLQLLPLDEQAAVPALVRGGAFYEIMVSGVGVGGAQCQPCVYQANMVVTPFALPSGSRGLAVSRQSELGLELEAASQASLGVLGHKVQGDQLLLALEPAPQERELVVEVRRVGRRCAVASVGVA